MFTTPTITQVTTDHPQVFAFRIAGEVTGDDMEAMATFVNHAFDVQEKINMLLIFADYQGSETGAAMNWESIKSQFRSLAHVDRYATLGAPSAAGTMVETMGALIPVKAQAFAAEDADAAWAFVGAHPA